MRNPNAACWCLCPALTLELAPLNGQVPGLGGAGGQQHGVVLGHQVLDLDVLAHVRVDHKAHALGRHQVHAALHHVDLRGVWCVCVATISCQV
jgi:hypothetical protein